MRDATAAGVSRKPNPSERLLGHETYLMRENKVVEYHCTLKKMKDKYVKIKVLQNEPRTQFSLLS
jgi:hypothetical protein